MRLITALEIAGNYPENIRISAQKDPNGNKWTSLMYMTRNGGIHKLMLSFDGFRFKTEELAVEEMKKAAKAAIEYVNKDKK